MAGSNDDDAKSSSKRTASRGCPICQRAAVEAYKPFCSKRCADVDLARWLGGRYAIPASDDEDADAEDFTPPTPTRDTWH
jgi:endogenous inhibitor of DNA gyrase (YacG/DUF329 family)